MADPIRITKKDHTLLGMERKLRNIEAAFVEIEALEADANGTIAMVNNVNSRPKNLKLALDPAGGGEAWIENSKKKVTISRPTS